MHGLCAEDAGERQTHNGDEDGDYAQCPVHRTQIAATQVGCGDKRPVEAIKHSSALLPSRDLSQHRNA